MTAQLPVPPPIPQIYSIAYIIAYVFLVVGVVEQFRSRGVISDLSSRNIVGLGVAPCTLVAPWLFTDWYWALAASALFLVLSALSMRFGLLSSVDAERGRFGGVALSIVLCVSVFVGWFFTDLGRGLDLRPLAAFSVFPSTAADSLAAMVGRRYGKGELRRARSKIGTAAGILGGVAAFVIVNLVFGFTGPIPYLLAVGFGGLAGPYAAVFAIVGTAGVLARKGAISGEAARKVIHIGVCNWIILAFFIFHDWYFAIVGPLSFIVINYVSWKLDLFKGMESGDKSPGTVFFAVSLSILTWHFWWLASIGAGDYRYVGVMGIRVLGGGDGRAAGFGHKWA